MPYLLLLVAVVWVTAIFVASVIYGARHGEAPLLGPMFRIRRQEHPVLYFVAMALLAAPAIFGVILSIGASWKLGPKIFPNTGVPGAPPQGYAPRSSFNESAGPTGYFPPALTTASYRCGQFPKPVPLLSPTTEAWYSEHLIAAHEPPLVQSAERLRSRPDSYRFIWLRSFEKPVIIRLDEVAGHRLFMTATRLSGKGGYEPGGIEAQVKRPLNLLEESRFRAALKSAKSLRLPPVTCDQGYDGARWVVEGVDRGRYRFVDRWSPKSGSVYDLGSTMLSFSGFQLKPKY